VIRARSSPVAAWLGVLLVTGCAGPQPSAPADPERARLEATLADLYAAFDFDPQGQPDWERLRELCHPQALFVPPLRSGGEPRPIGLEAWLAEFRDWVEHSPETGTGFHERIVRLRLEHFGAVAHAFVTFEGFVPGDGRAVTVGVDSLQLVRDGEQWRVVSFSTQYVGEQSPLPPQFERR
jgi:hypothetical protein